MELPLGGTPLIVRKLEANLLLRFFTYCQCFDISLDNSLALAAKHATNGIFQLLILNTKCLLGSTKQDDVRVDTLRERLQRQARRRPADGYAL